MRVVLLSGGSGKRLWPLSDDVRSKQFLTLFKTEDGRRESMARRVYRGLRAVEPNVGVTVATGKEQAALVAEQLGDAVDLCVEPCRRDTFPAIALAAARLRDVSGASVDESVVVCPVDPCVDASYFQALKGLADRAATSDANLVLMGIEPTGPSEKYGYIIPKSDAPIAEVEAFKEKPDVETAKKYLERGALWNGGVFAFRLGWLLEKAREIFPFADYDDLAARYADAPKISFDYAVVEKEPKIEVVRYSGKWNDLGTWRELTDALGEPVVGDAILDDECENVRVVDDLDLPVLCLGMKNCVVAVGPAGVLVADWARSSGVKPFVDEIERRAAVAEKSRASRRVLDVWENGAAILVTLEPGSEYRANESCDEVWTAIRGRGRTVVDGAERTVQTGDVVATKAGSRREAFAETELKLLVTKFDKKSEIQP